MEENITDLLNETNPVLVGEKERKVYGWFYDNVMAFALYAHDGIWPVGKRLDSEWTPIGYSEVGPHPASSTSSTGSKKRRESLKTKFRPGEFCRSRTAATSAGPVVSVKPSCADNPVALTT